MIKMADEKPIIKATTPNSKKYDAKVDVYTNDPRGDHESIHVAINSDNKSDTKPGSGDCYLTTACMKYFKDQFDDNCYELTVLRWFRDNFVKEEDIKHYYAVAPLIVETINKEEKADMVYDYIYDNIVDYCVSEIEKGNYDKAYSRYKNSVLTLEEQFAKSVLEKRLIKTLKLQIN